jgi:uncharacterized membrane protein YbhN (UPF0104 family)
MTGQTAAPESLTPPPPSARRRGLATAAKLILGLGLLAWLLSRLDQNAVATALGNLTVGPVLLLLLLVTLDRLVMAWKWNLLLRAVGLVVRLREVIRIYYVGAFFGLVLPTGIGGDAIRFLGISRATGDRAGTLASLVMEKALGMLGAALFAIFALWVAVAKLGIDLHGIPYALGGTLAAVVALLLLSLSEGFARRIHGLSARLRLPLAGKVAALHDAFLNYNRHRRTLLLFTGVTMAEQLIPVVHNMAVAWALGLPANIWIFVGLIPVILLLTRLPISLDAIGVAEGLYAFLFQLCGYSYSEGLLLAVVGRLSVYVSLLPALLLSAPRDAGVEGANTPR